MACVAEWFERKPNWPLLYINFSKILLKTESNEIGR
jgi:hypothetical protein